MANIENVTVSIALTINGAELAVADFQVPLRTTGDEDRPVIHIDRTALREKFDEAVLQAADESEAILAGQAAAAQTVLTCEECGAAIATSTPAAVRHEADGGHQLIPG